MVNEDHLGILGRENFELLAGHGGLSLKQKIDTTLIDRQIDLYNPLKGDQFASNLEPILMDKLKAMRVFSTVLSVGNYAEAGRRLGITRSAVSKAVTELETALAVRLLDRTTRQVHPTDVGLVYNKHCLDILERIDETERQVTELHEAPRGVLKISAPMSFGVLHLGQAIVDFTKIYPDLKIELLLNDRFIDPIEEGVDITIRIANLQDSSLIARKLAPANRIMVASPEYLSRHGIPEKPNDLAGHQCLNFGHSTTMQKWQLTKNGNLLTVPIESVFCSNNGDVLRLAALAGQGITMLPTFLVGPDVKNNKLKTILPDFPPTNLGIFALYAPNRYLAVKVRVFIDYLSTRFGTHPEWDDLNGGD